MARATSLITLKGKVGEFIFKRYGNKMIVSKTPDMSGIRPTKKQKARRSRFKDAVAYARAIVRNPARKAAYQKKLRRGKKVYQSAIAEYLQKHPA